MKYRIMECDLCGNLRKCKFYDCYEGQSVSLGIFSICDECLPEQRNVGETIEERNYV